MLPPREDDKVAGRIANRFVDGILARIAANDYVCAPALLVPVPKRAFTTRPAAVATLRDRIIYEALVCAARPKISRHLISSESLIWPRADESLPSWNNFERAPLEAGGGWVVSADVAGFYESVDHSRLDVALADAGVSSDIRQAIQTHLRSLMGANRGLPQGVDTSDSLATLYLSPVDSSLRRSDIRFWRHGDDYRIVTTDYPSALQAIFELEQALRRNSLLLNSGKLKIEKLGQYSIALQDVDLTTEKFREKMRKAREQALHESTGEELAKAAEDAGLDDDMQWRFFYHQTMAKDEFLEALAPSLTPKPVEIVTEMFKDLVDRRPKEKLPQNLAHARLVFCLRRLAQAKSRDALPWIGELLIRRPDDTQDLANYLLALVDSEPDQVVRACQFALTNKKHLLDWERAWIFRVLSRAPERVHKAIISTAQDIAVSDTYGWLSRIEALRLLARRGRLDKNITLRVARQVPESFQGDFVGIVAMAEHAGNWAAFYLDGAKQDALQAVVIDGVRAQRQRA
nr:RNA-directed DNA polymerase [Prauserella isguenensis]